MPQQSVTNTPEKGGWSTKGTLGGPFTAAGTGNWQFINGNFPMSICLEGVFTGLTGTIMVSNQMPQPPDTQDGCPLQTYTTLNAMPTPYIVSGPFRWIKFKPTAITTGSVSPTVYGGGGGGPAT